MDNDFAQVLVDELRIMNEWLSRIAKSLETTVVETIEYEKVPEVKEKVITTPGMAKLPKDINKSTLDFKKTHKIYKDPCNRCGGMITFEYYGKGIQYPIHIDANGKIIGNETCPEYGGS